LGFVFSFARTVICLLVAFALVEVHAKPIRLRSPAGLENAPGKTAVPTPAPQAGPRVSGLYLIQFREALKPEGRELLNAAGIELLRYVPEDAFIARFRNVSPEQARALPFVEWVGEFRPENKIHSAVQAGAARSAATTLNVSVVLAPRSTPAEIADARRPFAVLRQQSTLRFGTVLRGRISAAQVDVLSRSPAVLWIEPAADMKMVDEVASVIVAGEGPPGQLYTQSLGYDGSGVAVSVADSGLNNGDAATMHPDLFGRATNFFHYGSLTDAADEHSHGTHVAGIVAGDAAAGGFDENGFLWGLGVAPGARIITQRIFDGVGNYEAPPSFEALTRDATSAGAEIGSNSWGDDTQGRYDVSAMEFDALVRDANALSPGDQQYILEFSAGNAGPGPQTIGSPAVAKNVIATGACENDRPDLFIYSDGHETMADFSSRGPCEDGRIKPDITAPGTWIASLQSASAPIDNGWLSIDNLYLYMGGTSQAGPHASGAAAVFVQYYRETITNQTPSPALVKATLINSALDMDDAFGTEPVPNMDEGWGRIDLTQIIGSSRVCQFVDQTALLQTSQVYERRVIISNPAEELKVTLAYTDVPGFPGAIPALVNDLDLEVVAPNGTQYRGNQFLDGFSVPQPPNADRVNNVEAVHIDGPATGEYIIRVRAHNVAEDARVDTGALDQDFGLVISGGIAPPGFGVISIDRGAYRAPDLIRIYVADTSLAGNPSANVTVLSTTESGGEVKMLTAQGSSGVFTGTIATATGPAAPNGILQIANGDLIEVRYFDVSVPAMRTATAVADFIAPVLSNVSATNQFGHSTVSWTTDEPATAIVRYGTNPVLSSLTLAVTNSLLNTSHSVVLEGLVTGTTYYYYVVSADEAGNFGTNSNGGALYSFVSVPTDTVLLVDGFLDDGFGVPPLSGYTDPLDQLGVTYDVWDVATLGQPTFNTLKPYRVVMWRVPELSAAWTTTERTAISNYLHGGGSFFVASMEILSRLSENGGADFIQDVLHVQSYLVDGAGSTGAYQVSGSPAETVGHGLDFFTDYSVYATMWDLLIQFGLMPDPPDISDTITPDPDASPVLFNDADDVVGLRWPGVGETAPGRLVLLTFPFDAVPMGSGVNDRVHLLRNVLTFLAPGASGIGTLTLDSSAYTIPSLVTVELGDSDLADAGTVNVDVFVSSPTQTNSFPVTLYASFQPGVFGGSFELASGQNGDTVTVRYTDASSGIIEASAIVDTIVPSITNVDHDPDYEQATISWNTSEATDALVQFGESPFLERTGYSFAFTTDHTVTLIGLQPDRIYYYRVVSRDLGGNTVTDPGNGSLRTFYTLAPEVPPWSADMDDGATNWSVLTGDESTLQWTLGTPNNGSESSAHSPPNAWGSNLNGANSDYAQTFLISPAISLVGGNTATLEFWHSHEFTDGLSESDIYEFGDLLLFTNNNTSPILLAEYTDISGGWGLEEIDLSPYVGRVIYLVWDYELFSLESRQRPGWLVDDVSITMATVPPGTVQITNNLWQAPYALTGPVNQTGKGLGETITNAPPGQYVVNFGIVPFYQTPAPQTNTLVSSGTVFFTGNYTFTDANTNGMSDAWEQAYFGGVSTNRTSTTDTDGDGMSDYKEFQSGTDPTLAASRFHISSITRLGDGTFRLSWPSSIGRGYRVFGSSNLTSWQTLSAWTQAMSGTTTSIIPAPAPGAPNLFRVQVQP